MAPRDTPPHVDPATSGNPAAARYAERLQKQRYSAPPGGVTPPIPLLEGEHQPGVTMADQAVAARSRARPAAPLTGGIFPDAPPQAHGPRPHAGILTTDLLPERARQDERFQPGMGSMQALSQPHLAKEYGVMRNGQYIPPQQLQQGRPGLREETKADITQLLKLQEEATRAQEEAEDKREEEVAGASPSGAAARLAGGSEKPVTEDEKRVFAEAMKNMDAFDINTFQEMMMKDLLNSDEQREIVEERCAPLDLDTYIMEGRVTQRVPIIPGKYEPTFQSYTAEEDLALKRLLVLERKNFTDAPNTYFLDKYSIMGITMSLIQLNGNQLPGTSVNGNFNDAAFWVKFNKVVKMPFHLIASLGVHFYWFDIRVRKLCRAAKLGNG